MKKVLAGIFAVVVIALAYGIYLFNLAPSDTRTTKEAFETPADELVKEFSADELAASKKYVDQVIVVAGTVGEIKLRENEASVTLLSSDPMAGVTCSFYSDETATLKHVTTGMKIKIKGKCTGKLMDVVLNNCSLVN
jgi:hypothetical protein